MKRWFITGTDTGIGKTYAACALIRYLVKHGHRVAAMKPVASGCEVTEDGLRNEDALAMMAEMNVELGYDQVNPYAFEPAIAPHIAAGRAGQQVDISAIASLADSMAADHLVIEGAGGWLVPLDDESSFPDMARALEAEVVLVVGMKLGCINHALLSARQILQESFILRGWVANVMDPGMPVYDENMATLSEMMPCPLLCEIPWRGINADFGQLNV